MAAQVMQVQKKDDGILNGVMGTAMEMGKKYITDKIGGALGGAAEAAGGQGTSLKEKIEAGGSAVQSKSNPRDRRMFGGY